MQLVLRLHQERIDILLFNFTEISLKVIRRSKFARPKLGSVNRKRDFSVAFVELSLMYRLQFQGVLNLITVMTEKRDAEESTMF